MKELGEGFVTSISHEEDLVAYREPDSEGRNCYKLCFEGFDEHIHNSLVYGVVLTEDGKLISMSHCWVLGKDGKVYEFRTGEDQEYDKAKQALDSGKTVRYCGVKISREELEEVLNSHKASSWYFYRKYFKDIRAVV